MTNQDEQNEKLSLLTELIKLAKVDESLRDSEFQFLSAIANQIGVSQTDFENLFDEYIEFKPPIFEFDRIIQLQRLVLLMNIDQVVEEKQLYLIKNLGIRMGLNPLAVAEVLDTMHKYPNMMLPPEKLISIFRTFHN
jgi:hypothetical protein